MDKQKVFNVMTETGNMDVKYDARNNAFTTQAKEWQQTYLKHAQDASKHSVEIYKKSIDLANCINNLARSFE